MFQVEGNLFLISAIDILVFFISGVQPYSLELAGKYATTSASYAHFLDGKRAHEQKHAHSRIYLSRCTPAPTPAHGRLSDEDNSFEYFWYRLSNSSHPSLIWPSAFSPVRPAFSNYLTPTINTDPTLYLHQHTPTRFQHFQLPPTSTLAASVKCHFMLPRNDRVNTVNLGVGSTHGPTLAPGAALELSTHVEPTTHTHTYTSSLVINPAIKPGSQPTPRPFYRVRIRSDDHYIWPESSKRLIKTDLLINLVLAVLDSHPHGLQSTDQTVPHNTRPLS